MQDIEKTYTALQNFAIAYYTQANQKKELKLGDGQEHITFLLILIQMVGFQ